jgi:hypothetical protein
MLNKKQIQKESKTEIYTKIGALTSDSPAVC